MLTKYKEKIDKRIEEVTQIFIKEFNPYKIILFGSFGRGDYKTTSSIDILIVADSNLPFIERIKHAINISAGSPPVEPLVYTREEYAKLVENNDFFIENLMDEGRELYSRS